VSHARGPPPEAFPVDRNPETNGRRLRGPWSDISELYYHPSADSYGIAKETFMETVAQEEY
jgi:hypothetical protein